MRKSFYLLLLKTKLFIKKISADLEVGGVKYSTTQCLNKFKYLKMRYMKWKDSQKRSGAATFRFEYASELDEIFGKKPTINPPVIASSQREIIYSESSADEGSTGLLQDDVEPPTKKIKT
ncbi:hypothetical protein NQ314_013185 [Rhamnusium bicolor]|uniref:Myb/SANT-like DNA-binding domain-containing protein n=1 Tax=Rhamnusium bicolor TaxID=1586634 RepID=A0AAV8X8L3_9CUCU|nr:hypothetical protein NQ314_013185 [Rhamnusium bicolor]